MAAKPSFMRQSVIIADMKGARHVPITGGARVACSQPPIVDDYIPGVGYRYVSVFGMQRVVQQITMQDFPVRSPRHGALNKYF